MPRTPRLTKKPLPRTRQGWQNEVDGIRGFLDELRDVDGDLLGGWAGKQRAYYTERLNDLLAHPPRQRQKATA